MAEIGLTPQNIAPPAPPQFEGRTQPLERSPQTQPAVDQLEISPEADQRLAEVQASDNAAITSTQLSVDESERPPSESRGVTDFQRQQAISSFQNRGGLFEPPPELFDEKA
ncbi:MAG: hypothetical protein H6751_10615 [Candidatus Omnitrophica bacterium]|nr:hypothetical protein [Candidatus Omnitrophota bacterium]MCB9783402.1 hypothetical protein [Candidatus Omnitrophota bacterium]